MNDPRLLTDYELDLYRRASEGRFANGLDLSDEGAVARLLDHIDALNAQAKEET